MPGACRKHISHASYAEVFKYAKYSKYINELKYELSLRNLKILNGSNNLI